MKNIIRAEDLPLNETVYLKKGKFGYRIVHPTKNEDGSINWINISIGGWENFWKLIFILVTIFLFLYGVSEMLEGCNDMAENPCEYTDLDCSIENMIPIPDDWRIAAYNNGKGQSFGGEDDGEQYKRV